MKRTMTAVEEGPASRQQRPRRERRGEPGVRLIARLYGAREEITMWLERLEAMPGSRRAPLPPDLPPQIARVIERARRAAAREIGEDWLVTWARGEKVSNADAMIALLQALDALGEVTERWDAVLG